MATKKPTKKSIEELTRWIHETALRGPDVGKAPKRMSWAELTGRQRGLYAFVATELLTNPPDVLRRAVGGAECREALEAIANLTQSQTAARMAKEALRREDS